MKVFVTGVGGQLGFNVVNELKKRGYEAIGSDILDEVAADCAYVKLDITNADAGCGLIKYGSALVPFINRFPRDTKLYRLMTTKPGEGVFGGERAKREADVAPVSGGDGNA